MDGFSQVFIFTDAAPGIFGKSRGDMFIFAVLLLGGVLLAFFFHKVINPSIRHVLGLLSAASGLTGGLFLFTLLLVHFNTLSEYRALQDAYNRGLYQVAEGVVNVSHIQPLGCDVTGDLIQVEGVEFEINLCHGATFSYNQTIKNNGMLTDGAEVRLYYTEGKTILRVDVKR